MLHFIGITKTDRPTLQQRLTTWISFCFKLIGVRVCVQIQYKKVWQKSFSEPHGPTGRVSTSRSQTSYYTACETTCIACTKAFTGTHFAYPGGTARLNSPGLLIKDGENFFMNSLRECDSIPHTVTHPNTNRTRRWSTPTSHHYARSTGHRC